MRRALLLLFAAALLAGCGGDTVSLDPIAQAADKTDDVASARFVMNAAIVDPDEGLLKFSGRGAYADHGKTMRMRMTLAPTAATPRFAMEMVVVGSTYYMRSPLFGVVLPRGKRWLAFHDRDAAALSSLSQQDPAQILEFLRATAEIEELGSETVRGVRTTHYKAEVDLDRVVDHARPDQRERVRQVVDQIERAGIDTMPLEVWVDSENLVRRMKMDWTVSDKPGQTASIKITMDLFDFGADVAVKAPPAGLTFRAPPEIAGG